MPATTQSARPRQNLRNNVNPCEICGILISRKSDIRRHVKTHATDDAEKLPCPFEDCEFRTLQKSNLVTHINRHKKEKPYSCTDCKFTTSDPASLLRHKKRLHGYIPRNSVVCKVKKPNRHVPISLIRGIDLDSSGSARLALQFSTFSSTEASTSPATSSSQQLLLPHSPLPSPTPTTLPPFPPSHSPSGYQSHVHSFPLSTATNSFAESKVLSSSTLIASTSHHEFTPEGPYPTVLSTASYPVYAESQLHHDSLIFAPWPLDRPSAAELWDGSMVPSDESEILDYQHPEEVVQVYDAISGEQEMELNIPAPGLSSNHDADPSWPGIDTTGRLIGPDGLPLPLDTQQLEAPSSLPYTTQVVEQHPIHVGPLNQTHHLVPTIEGFHHNESEYDHSTHYQLYSAPSQHAMVPNALDYCYSTPSPDGMVPNALDYCYQHYSTPSPHEMYTSPHDVGASLGYYDTMSLDCNNLNYHGFNTGVSPHVAGFANPSVAQDDAQYIWIWN